MKQGQRKKLSTEALPDYEVLPATFYVTKKGATISTSGQAIPPYPSIEQLQGQPVQVRWGFELVQEEGGEEGFVYNFTNADSPTEEDMQAAGVPQEVINQIINP